MPGAGSRQAVIVPSWAPESSSGSSEAGSSSCPPEIGRERHAPREARADSPRRLPDPAAGGEGREGMQTAALASELDGNGLGGGEKIAHMEHARLRPTLASLSLAPEPRQPIPSQPITSEELERERVAKQEEAKPLYLSHLGSPRERPSPHSTTSFLRPGSKFRGTQQSDRQQYDVQVEIKDVDLVESFLCGYLRIQGLTEDHPTLTTFFEGEIVGDKYHFRTEHPSWKTEQKIDREHWARFPPWLPFANTFRTDPAFTLKNSLQREHLFMRWKEYFLVPDHRVKNLNGASFEGFYYICFDQRVGSVSGMYFHAKSEKFQQLELKHVPDGGCMGAVEFR